MKTPRFYFAAAAASLLLSLVTATRLPAQSGQGSDLAHYMSRPDLRPPLLKLDTYEADEVTPGYWFTAPYGALSFGKLNREYVPYQNGPHIYDHRGELVWSGGPLVEYRNVYDFRVGQVNGTQILTVILDSSRLSQSNYSTGPTGFIIDETYQVAHQVKLLKDYNMHEFNIVDNNRVIIATEKVENSVHEVNELANIHSYFSSGFREWDLDTERNLFEWWASDHVPLNDSMARQTSDGEGWDVFHINSIDKDANGDYFVSLRHASTLYKISHVDGSVIWRLGGKFSDFEQNFNFSSQHHSRIISQDDSGMIITVFDNAADHRGRQPTTADASSMKVIKIYEHEQPRRAELLAQYVRPDGLLTDRRGSGQILESGNAFVSWSDQGYISEHTADGRVVMEAKYLGDRFVTYRAYHFADWVGRPTEPPALMSFAQSGGSKKLQPSTVLYVSWNGATEVASWKFFGASDIMGNNTFHELGSVPKISFESSMAVDGYWRYTYAEAYDAQGNLLGKSDLKTAILPDWAEAEFEHEINNGSWIDWTARLSMSEDALTLQASKPVAGFGSSILLLCLLYTIVSICMSGWRKWLQYRSRQRYAGHQGDRKAFNDEETNILHDYTGVAHNDEDDDDDDDDDREDGSQEKRTA